jgi:phage shock protein A
MKDIHCLTDEVDSLKEKVEELEKKFEKLQAQVSSVKQNQTSDRVLGALRRSNG